MYFKILIFFLIKFSLILAQNQTLHPITKSIILPGWGESSLGETKRARIFYYSEIVLWTSYLSSVIFNSNQEKKYISFAAKHAGVKTNSKDHKYWVDIGNYESIEFYNDEHLRFREPESTYPQGSNSDWYWDDNENRKKFENMRIHADKLSLAGNFIIGGIILNHIISSIDALYLVRLNKINPISFQPIINRRGDIWYSFNINFY
tara:strand:+ start:44037 stop:44651 length:615 start_codon:yes stop_codon:yes gene_type:complete